MPLHTLFGPIDVLQTIVLALSIFNLIAFLWLAFTVWLNGDRRSLIARVGVVGLSLSALFFFIHALLISSPITQTSGILTPYFLWHLFWVPTLPFPFICFLVCL